MASHGNSISPVTSSMPMEIGKMGESNEFEIVEDNEGVGKVDEPNGENQERGTDGERGIVEERAVAVTEDEPDTEDIRKPRAARRPYTPTKAEVLEHFPLHLVYRSWCAHCVAGKSTLAQHNTEDPDRVRLGTTWSMDSCFLGPEEREEDMQPCLI